MKMNDLPKSAPAGAATAATLSASPEVFKQLGQITRHLHDALTQLGVMPRLQRAADGLPDVRTRLNYIANKAGESANRVLTSVDQAKAEHAAIVEATRRIGRDMQADPLRPPPVAQMLAFVGKVEAATARIDTHLTDIMLAQDFHDLTGQVVAKVMALAGDLEDSLVKLLVQAAPAEVAARPEPSALGGPVIDPQGRTDVVANQREVDDLLASMGF
jgi:chemotaxis protein CheZ